MRLLTPTLVKGSTVIHLHLYYVGYSLQGEKNSLPSILQGLG